MFSTFFGLKTPKNCDSNLTGITDRVITTLAGVDVTAAHAFLSRPRHQRGAVPTRGAAVDTMIAPSLVPAPGSLKDFRFSEYNVVYEDIATKMCIWNGAVMLLACLYSCLRDCQFSILKISFGEESLQILQAD